MTAKIGNRASGAEEPKRKIYFNNKVGVGFTNNLWH